jgi:undecaprenyl-diphosphatase
VFKQIVRSCFILALIALLIAAFFALTDELREATEGQPELIGFIDYVVLKYAEVIRRPWLSTSAVVFTSLGSQSTIVLLTALLILMAAARMKLLLCFHFISAAAGASIISQSVKHLYERQRPDFIAALVEAHGYSYPSSHALVSAAVYLTIAIVAARFCAHWLGRILLYVLALGLILLVALSRVYLGVHYPSDVLAGFLLGTAWALFLGMIFSTTVSKKSAKITLYQWRWILGSWAIMMGLEFVHGALRNLLIAPWLGDFPARQWSVLTASCINFAVAYWSYRKLGITDIFSRWVVGFCWLFLSLIFELGLGRWIFHLSWERISSDFNLLHGGLLPLGMAMMTISPHLVHWLRNRKHGSKHHHSL